MIDLISSQTDAKYPLAETMLNAKVGFVTFPNIGAGAGVDKNACENYLSCPLEPETPTWINTTFVVPNTVPSFVSN